MSARAEITKFSANGSKEMQLLHLQWDELVAPFKTKDKDRINKKPSRPQVVSIKKSAPSTPPPLEERPVTCDLQQQSKEQVEDYAEGLVTGCVTKKIQITEENSIKFIGLVDLTRQIKGTLEVALAERDVVTKNYMIRDIICVAAEVLKKFKEDGGD